MSTLSCSIGGISNLQVLNASPEDQEQLEVRGQLQITIVDSAGVYVFTRGQPVEYTDSARGIMFTGFVNNDVPQKLSPDVNNTTILHVVTCYDGLYRLDKRTNDVNYLNWFAGDVATDMVVNGALKEEGVTIPANLHRDSTVDDWNTGLLDGVTGYADTTDGDLELTRSGTDVTITEASQADFNTGTLTGVTAQDDNTLTPSLQSGIQFVTTGTGYISAVIWTGTKTIGTSDKLLYDTWGKLPGTVRFLCSDGTDYIANQGTDTTTNPSTDDVPAWWSRNITLPSAYNGKTITQVEVGLVTPDNTDTTYFRNIRLNSATGSPFFSTTATTFQTTPFLGHITGNVTFTTSILQTCSPGTTMQRISPAYDISGAGVLKTTFGQFTAILPKVSGSGSSDTTTCTVEASFDGGAIWQVVTSGVTLAGALLAGSNLLGKTLTLRETFTSLDPSVYPILENLTATIYSAPECDKTDAFYSASLAAGWNAGTLTNLTVVNDSLHIPNYQTAVSGFGTNSIFNGGGDLDYFTSDAGSPAENPSSIGATNTSFLIAPDIVDNPGFPVNDYHTHFRFVGIGNYSTMLAQYNPSISGGSDSGGEGYTGLTYLNQSWNTTANNFGYWVKSSSSSSVNNTSIAEQITLIRGSSGGSTTTLAGPITLTATQRGQLKQVVYSGGNHKIYTYDSSTANFTKIIDVNDSTYTTGANLGVYTSQSGGSHGSDMIFNTLKVTAGSSGTGIWVSPSTNLSSIGTYGNSQVLWTAVSNNFLVEVSIDNGLTYVIIPSSGSAIPGITPGTSLSGKTLKVRVTVYDPFNTYPQSITGLRVQILGPYSSSGTRSTAPEGIDYVDRANQSGWGTASDGQAWTASGTGTKAVATNKLTISSTTGDVLEQLGTRTDDDLEATVRFLLAASGDVAGMLLRYVDRNNYYLLTASTTSIAIVKKSSGAAETLATVSSTLTTGVLYYMRFRVTDAGPVHLFARIWPDGTLEDQTVWTVQGVD